MTAAALVLLMSLAQNPPAEQPSPAPRGMPHARLYLGPSTARQGGAQFGAGGVVGYQWFNEISPATASFFGLEILGWQVGTGVLPIFTGDFGLRWAPWPYAFLRPYATLNLGLSLLVILPVPSLALGLGLALPLGPVTFDAAFRVRGALNLFDTAQSVTIASIELGVGF
jgi:hypothetical protein